MPGLQSSCTRDAFGSESLKVPAPLPRLIRRTVQSEGLSVLQRTLSPSVLEQSRKQVCVLLLSILHLRFL